jgi:hypothetical protein
VINRSESKTKAGGSVKSGWRVKVVVERKENKKFSDAQSKHTLKMINCCRRESAGIRVVQVGKKGQMQQ